MAYVIGTFVVACLLFIVGGGYAFTGVDLPLWGHMLAFTLGVGLTEELCKVAVAILLAYAALLALAVFRRLALRLRGKLFILNENGDYFWFDRANFGTLVHFALFRLGLAGAGAVMTIGRILLFPVSLIYLLAFAGIVHAKRKARA